MLSVHGANRDMRFLKLPVTKEIQVEAVWRLAGICDKGNAVSFDLKHNIVRGLNVGRGTGKVPATPEPILSG